MRFNLFNLATVACAAVAQALEEPQFATLAIRDNSAVVTSSTGLSFYSANLSSGTAGYSNPSTYTCYKGPASNFPAFSSWMNFNAMWSRQVQYNLGPQGTNDTSTEIAWIKSAILSVSQTAMVDARVILAMVIQESSGNPNVGCTTSFGGVPNCGLMQSYNPADKSYNGTQASILQMIQDGTQGTAAGPGMVQLINDAAGTPQMTGGNIYKAFREYNSGTVNQTDLSNGEGAVSAYVSDLANYLLGWNGYGNAPASCGFVNTTPTSTTHLPTHTGTATAAPPAPTVSGTTAQCYQWYTTQSGDTCATIDNMYQISFAYFQSLNTYINNNCTNLFSGYAYCVNGVAGAQPQGTATTTTTSSSSKSTTTSSVTSAPPAPTVSGTSSACYTWYTTRSGDTCATIEQDYNITLAHFQSLNTFINAQCTNLYSGYAYCVNGVPVSTSTVTTTTITSTSTTSSSSPTQAAPAPTVSGTTTSCYTWYTTKSGDTCATIDQAYNITFSYFQSLNTFINTQCTNLYAGYAYCVNGVPVNSGTSNAAVNKSVSSRTASSTSSKSSSTSTSSGTKKTTTTTSTTTTASRSTSSSTKKTTTSTSTSKTVTSTLRATTTAKKAT